MQTTPPMTDVEWRLPRHARSVGRARRLLREQAGSWSLPPGVADTAELLLSELMTNAYRHAKAPGRELRVRLALSEAELRVAVTDASDVLPVRPDMPAPCDETGRGLHLVAALADDWGAEPRACGVGKTVWCALRVPGGQTRRRAVAQRVSSWRLESWSLRRTAETWDSTVLTEMKSCFAISLYA